MQTQAIELKTCTGSFSLVIGLTLKWFQSSYVGYIIMVKTADYRVVEKNNHWDRTQARQDTKDHCKKG